MVNSLLVLKKVKMVKEMIVIDPRTKIQEALLVPEISLNLM
jgi:hypothetical protein